VRNLKKLLEKIYRKVAFKLVKRQGKEAQASSASAATGDSSGPEAAVAPSGDDLAVFCAYPVLVRS
jgi:ATP-dependent Lon protease